MGQDEFFATLRQNQVFHLGQVESVIIETDGQLSIFFYPDEKVRHGLPILPDVFEECRETISEEGTYSCFACGTTDQLGLSNKYSCQNCQHVKCVKALNGKRIR